MVQESGEDVKALRFICLPQNGGPNVPQFIRMFMAYARANPQEHHQSAVWGALNALNPAFPCTD